MKNVKKVITNEWNWKLCYDGEVGPDDGYEPSIYLDNTTMENEDDYPTLVIKKALDESLKGKYLLIVVEDCNVKIVKESSDLIDILNIMYNEKERYFSNDFIPFLKSSEHIPELIKEYYIRNVDDTIEICNQSIEWYIIKLDLNNIKSNLINICPYMLPNDYLMLTNFNINEGNRDESELSLSVGNMIKSYGPDNDNVLIHYPIGVMDPNESEEYIIFTWSIESYFSEIIISKESLIDNYIKKYTSLDGIHINYVWLEVVPEECREETSIIIMNMESIKKNNNHMYLLNGDCCK